MLPTALQRACSTNKRWLRLLIDYCTLLRCYCWHTIQKAASQVDVSRTGHSIGILMLLLTGQHMHKV
jgi:hypothetical protein